MLGTSNRLHRKRRPSPIENFEQNQSNFHHSLKNNLLFANEVENKSYNFNQQQVSHNFEQNNRLKQSNFCHFPIKQSNNNYSVTASLLNKQQQQPSTDLVNQNFQQFFFDNTEEVKSNHSTVSFYYL